MRQINPPQPAPALQEAILQQKTLVPEPERRWFRSYWKSCSAAAMFLMICSLLYFMSTNEILQKAEEKQVFMRNQMETLLNKFGLDMNLLSS